MVSIILNRPIYGSWNVVEESKVSDEEKAQVSKVVVVESDFGNSACFFLKSGGCTYIPMDNSSSKGAGELLDINSITIKRLEKGSESILRVHAE